MDLEKKVLKAVKSFNLISPGDRILIAFSGGPDSVVLATVLLKLQRYLKIDKLSLAHLNHKLRKESDQDEKFCVEFALKNGLNIFTRAVDVASLSKDRKRSIEDVGRQERYSFLREIAFREGYSKIATAHHLSDLAETMTLWFIQGNKKGLKGFKPKNDNIIRPLFLLKKEEILEYCQGKSLEFVFDTSNLSEKYLRNKVRHKVIPVLKQINSSLELSLERMSFFINLDEDFFSKEVDKLLKELKQECIPFDVVRQLDKAILYRVFQSWLEKKGVYPSYQNLREILEYTHSPSEGSYLKLPGGYRLTFKEDAFYLLEDKSLEKKGFSYKLKIGQKLYIKEANCWIESFRMEKVQPEILKSKDLVCFDLEGEEFIVRSKMEGDKIIPFGRTSEKKVKDIFIDMKVPKNKRNNIPILVFGDKILWVCGYRRSALFPVNENSKNVICFKLIKEV